MLVNDLLVKFSLVPSISHLTLVTRMLYIELNIFIAPNIYKFIRKPLYILLCMNSACRHKISKGRIFPFDLELYIVILMLHL